MTVEQLYGAIGGNYKEALKRMASDRLVTRFIIRFLDDSSFQQLMNAWESQDNEQIFRSAHTLKGVCANLSLDLLFENVNIMCEAYRDFNNVLLTKTQAELLLEILSQDYYSTIEKIKEFANQ